MDGVGYAAHISSHCRQWLSPTAVPPPPLSFGHGSTPHRGRGPASPRPRLPPAATLRPQL